MKKLIYILLLTTLGANAQVELVSSGISGFYDLTVPGTFQLTNGLQVTFKAHANFDPSSKLNVSLSGAKNITKLGGSANIAGTDILSGQIVTVAYDGTTWQMISASSFTPPAPATYWIPSGADIYNNTGNVGIGTTTPANLLHVNDPSNTQGTLQITAGTGTGTSSLDGLMIISNSVGSFILNRENTPLYFGTNSVNRMSILANGNVGIGVTPTLPFDVANSTQTMTSRFINTFNGASNTAVYGWTTGAGTGTNYGGSFESSGSPTNYGIYGRAYGTTSNYGSYSTSTGGTTNYGSFGIANGNVGSKTGVFGRASGTSAGTNIGGAFEAFDATGNNYAVSGTAAGTTGNNVGGYFAASGGSTNHALKLVDGTEGADKILTSDASGNASWKGSINFSSNASTTTIPSGTTTTIVYTNTEYNNGGAYNSATGVFTAPISGIYHFDASIAIPATSSWQCQLQILRNGGTHKIAYGNYIPIEGLTFATISVDIYLPISNTIAIGVYQGSVGGLTPTGSQAVFFTGHLIR